MGSRGDLWLYLILFGHTFGSYCCSKPYGLVGDARDRDQEKSNKAKGQRKMIRSIVRLPPFYYADFGSFYV